MSMTRHTVTVNWNLSLTNSAKTQAQGQSNVIIFLITTQFVHREIQMSHGDTKKNVYYYNPLSRLILQIS